MQNITLTDLWRPPSTLPVADSKLTITVSGEWTCPYSGEYVVVCIGGGGAGAAWSNPSSGQGTVSSAYYYHRYNGGGGGGAGYVQSQTLTLVRNGGYMCAVGAAKGSSTFGGSLCVGSAGANAARNAGGAGGGTGANANATYGAGSTCSHTTGSLSGNYSTLRGARGAGGDNGTGHGAGGVGGYVVKGTKRASGGNHTAPAAPTTTSGAGGGDAGAIQLWYLGRGAIVTDAPGT